MRQVKIKQHLKEIPKPVLDALVRGEVVPFVGAGFSRNCEGPNGFVMPDWKTLGKSVAGELVNYEYDGNPIDALSTYESQFQRINLIDLMRKEFRLDAIYPGEAHKLFVGCFPGIVCTTNFDTLIVDKSSNPKNSKILSDKFISNLLFDDFLSRKRDISLLLIKVFLE